MRRIIPTEVSKYWRMSKRERQFELRRTLWYTPLLYIFAALLVVALTLYVDLGLDISQYMGRFYISKPTVTRTLVSSLIGGILTLNAFTFNSLLVVLTSFSGQFSPRLLMNFISDRQTQHVLGIFNGCFVYVLCVFLFITNNDHQMYTLIPLTTVLIAFFAVLTFIYFINHSTTWLQVHNLTGNMKKESQQIMHQSLYKELEPYRVSSEDEVDFKNCEGEGKVICADTSGYIQIVDYANMVASAKSDDIVVRLEYSVGDYVLKGTPLITYWCSEPDEIDETAYCQMVVLGIKQTEIQDLEFGITKLTEIAVKSLGQDDVKTAQHVLHDIADLMLSISNLSSLAPYLVDGDKELRIILQEENFEYYLMQGYGNIRYYAEDNYIILSEMLDMLAIMAKAMGEEYYQLLWQFGCETYDRMKYFNHYPRDLIYISKRLEKLAEVTGFTRDFEWMKYNEQE